MNPGGMNPDEAAERPDPPGTDRQGPRTQSVPVLSPGAPTRVMSAVSLEGQSARTAESAASDRGPAPFGAPAPARRRPLLWASLAAGLVLVLGVGGLVLLQQRGTGDEPSTVVAETATGADANGADGGSRGSDSLPDIGNAQRGDEEAGDRGSGGGPAGDGSESGTGQQEGADSGNGAGDAGGASGGDVPAGTRTTGEYSAYVNERYGFSAEVPDGWSQHEADNGDGLTLRAPEGPAEMLVYGTNTGLSGCGGEGTVADCQELRREELADEGSSVTYEAAREDWFVLSGYRADGDVYYERRHVGSGGSAVLVVTYPEDLSELCAPVIERVSVSLEPGDLSLPH